MNRYIERWWQNTTSLKGVRIVHALFIFCKEARISLPSLSHHGTFLIGTYLLTTAYRK